MSANAVNTSTLVIGQPHVVSPASSALASLTGFYFSLRLAFVLVAVRFFHRDPQDGVIAGLALNYLLLAAAAFYAAGPSQRTVASLLRLPCFSWVLCFLGLSGLSLSWSVTASLPAAVAFWCAMAADTAIVVLLLRAAPVDSVVTSLIRGFVWGSCVIAAVAWALPSQSDLRLGDEELLGPNQIGWICAFAFFFAQYLIRSNCGNWTIQALLLAVTLLRSLSKTTLIAFVIGEAYIMLRDRSMSRRTRLLLSVSALLIVLIFSSLLTDYYAVYTNAGNQADTLTGRLGIWAFITNEGVEKPWFGHGFHSVWKVIPPFGEFEARHAHNELLQQFYAYGAVGVLLLIAIYSSVYRQLRRYLDASQKTFFVGMLLLVIVRGIADTEAFDLSLPLWFIVLIGALVEQSRNRRQVFA
jgi:exopolysaccharide production protein ExoQ